MDVAEQFTTRINDYLKQVTRTNQRWSEWLQLGESAGISLDQNLFATFEQQASEVTGALQALTLSRQALLEAAEAAGLPSYNVQALARSLPAWQQVSFRSAIETVRQQLNQLRRMHVAAFILLHQSLHQSRETMRLLSTGAGQSPVYCGNDSLDGGGQLLDAAL